MLPLFKRLLFPLLAASLLPALALAAAAPTEWLLSYEGKSTNQFVWDKRTAGLVQTRIPAKLSEQVLRGLGGPPDPVYVTDHRYVSASACVPHDCGDKGFLWVDTKTGVGLGATFGYEDKLTLGSNGLSAAAIPPQARHALMDWIAEQDIKPASVEFIGSADVGTALRPEDFQPRAKYQPPLAGPSFDCASHLNAIEQAICGDAELKALDRDVAELFERIRHGTPMVGARQQLLDLQRAWLKTRNATCAHAAAINNCLKDQYTAQHERLENWVPTH